MEHSEIIRRLKTKPFTCAKCGGDHKRYRDHDKTIGASYCTKCHAEYMRATRRKHGELTDEQRKKANCRSYTNVLLRRMALERKTKCEQCGAESPEKHHPDYSDPRKVVWLCRDCHLELHRNERVVNE